MATTPCIPCYKDFISCGLETLHVIGRLVADADYIWTLTNKGAKYQGAVTTDTAGGFEIAVNDLPEGLLNPYAGPFILTVQNDDAYDCNSSTWNDSAYCDPYDCIEFDVLNGTFTKNTLGCPCELI